jgi:pSer/pThr/pTyr-binding forkhead associated (FHA) protein
VDLRWLDGPPRAGSFQLVRIEGGFPVRRHVFVHGLVRIGRGEDCDLRLDDPRASRDHALIERQAGDVYVIHDQMSVNGVKVNGERVDRSRRLEDGDVLLLGATRLLFQTGLASFMGVDPPDDVVDEPLAPPPPPPVHRAETPTGAGAAAGPPTARQPGAARPTLRLDAARPPAVAGPSGAFRVELPPATPAPVPAPAGAAPGPMPTWSLGAAPAGDGPPSDSSPDLPPPVDPSADPALATVFGRTIALSPRRQAADQRETGVQVRAVLRATDERRWSASHLAPARGEHVIARDVVELGAGPGADVPLEGVLMPRVVAVIVRGVSGFSLCQVTGWPWATRVNGRLVLDRTPLEDGDVLVVAGHRFTFHRTG